MTQGERRASMGSQIPQKPKSSERQTNHHVRMERRANPRYQLSTPPEVEILQAGNGKPFSVRLIDISRGGCFVETDHELPLEVGVTVTLKKSGDFIKALARVVRVGPRKGLALEFTSMESEDFRLLDGWLSLFV